MRIARARLVCRESGFLRADLLVDPAHSRESGCLLRAQRRIGRTASDQAIVVSERDFQELLAQGSQVADLDRILPLQQGVLTDLGEVVLHRPAGQSQVGLGLGLGARVRPKGTP